MNFAGVFPYLVSPVSTNGHVRTDVLSRLADDLIVAGVASTSIADAVEQALREVG